MKRQNSIYRLNQSLLTDLYQLTMAYGYWKSGIYNREAVFHLYYRKNPFDNAYAVACGLEPVIEYLQNLQFSESDVSFLGSLRGNDGKALFNEHFLNFLQRFKFTCDVEAVEEGAIVLPNEPLLRVKGPLWQANLLETALLTIVNFSTLIATKASRVVKAAAGDVVLEFGLRRAQGFDGGLTASRAAYIGGCHATSNVAAGKLFGIPVKGTHAHSWVLSWDDEQAAFEGIAEALPNNVTFLVDTYDSFEGIDNAIAAARNLKAKGIDIQSIRLDSGDLLPLSIEARKRLDLAGLAHVQIIASNDLDEYSIAELKAQGAPIDVWGVGTRLVTAFDQPALGGVYKLAALKNDDGTWDYKMKISSDAFKKSIPGVLQVRRVTTGNGSIERDLIYDVLEHETLPDGYDLLKPIFRNGQLVYQMPDIQTIRKRTRDNIQDFEKKVGKNFGVSLENKLILRSEKLSNQKMRKEF